MNISISDRLLRWYDPNLRDLPWKSTRDPYRIWLSEIILQQTRVEQGRPYYLKFVEEYETVADLANAPLNNILKLWEGLGYYSRARNLHTAAKQVMDDFGGRFPTDYKGLLTLKGVGPYTAAAIASFAYDEPVAVVDGNVFRVLSRIYGIADPIDTGQGQKMFRQLAADALDKQKPAEYNQAIMDFGALVCVPSKPDCASCPFSIDCVAFDRDMVSQLPVKSRKPARRTRYFHFIILHDDRRVVIQQREGKGIWHGLHQFPLEESDRLPSAKSLKQWKLPHVSEKEWERNLSSINAFGPFKQLLSHQEIQAVFSVIGVKDLEVLPQGEGWKTIPLVELDQYAFPRIIHQFLEEFTDQLPDINGW